MFFNAVRLSLSVILCGLLSACDLTATEEKFSYWHNYFFQPEPQKNTYQPQFSAQPPQQVKQYIFAIHPLHNPQRLFKVFNPLMNYLTTHIAGVRFRLEASRNYAAFDEKLYAQQFDFALPNPFQTIKAIDKGYRVFAKMGDDSNFRGIILVRKDSGIKQVTDLIGKAVSYPALTALAATMMPQYYLQTHGVKVMSQIDNRYVGSQESSIMNVYLGDTAAGATWPPPWQALAKERPELAEALEVKWQTEPLLNNSVLAAPQVPDSVVEQVKQLLLSLHEDKNGQQILSGMELSRFEAANNSTYDPVREFIKVFTAQVRPVDSKP